MNCKLLYIVVGLDPCDCCGHYRSFTIDSLHLTEEEAQKRINTLESSDNYEYYGSNYKWDIEWDTYKLNRILISEVDKK